MYIIFVVSLFLCSSSLATHVITVPDYLSKVVQDTELDFPVVGIDAKGILDKYGYPLETYEVTTEDGYILSLHRIPHGKNETGEEGTKPAVLLMHGLMGSSIDFFLLGTNKSLALMLVDQGYDVWLGNNRGNTWSRKHTTLNPDDLTTFWDFSFHEFGVYDDPAIIDYILKTTGSETISYVGHSLGATQFFAMASMKPDYNDKINLVVALAPSVYEQHVPNPLAQIFKDYYEVLEFAADYLNLTELLPHTTLLSTVLKIACGDSSDYKDICPIVFFLIYGIDSQQLDTSMLPTLLDNFPAGTSTMQIKHLFQEIKSGHFRQFDYGVIKNLDIYDQAYPPDYNISLITAPVALYYGNNDWMVGIEDVDKLAEELPNVVEKHLINYELFNNIDFLYAIDVVPLLYYDVVNLLNSYNGFESLPTTSPKTTVTTVSSDPNATDPITPDDPTDSSTIRTTTPSAGVLTYNLIEFLWISVGMIVVKFLM